MTCIQNAEGSRHLFQNIVDTVSVYLFSLKISSNGHFCHIIRLHSLRAHKKMASPAKQKKINKSEKSKVFFDLVDEKNPVKMYTCKECTKAVNGTRTHNLTSHLSHVHPEIFSELCRENPTIETERLKLLLDCVELVGVNGRPFRCLTDSAIQSMNEKLLEKLKSEGRDLNLRDENLIEVKDELMNISNEIREKIANEVKNQALSVLVDLVTKRGRSILGISIQYRIDCILKIRSIGMIEINKRHTGKHLADIIIKRLKELGMLV